MHDFLDETIRSSECFSYLSTQSKEIAGVKSTTRWNCEEVDALFLIYYKLGFISSLQAETDFRQFLYRVFSISDEILGPQIEIFFSEPDKFVNAATFASRMSSFLNGKLVDLIRVCWKVYCGNKKDAIKRGDIVKLLNNAILKVEVGEAVSDIVRDLADVLLKKLDLKRQGLVDFTDFRRSVLHNPLLLECMGKALPPRKARDAFATTFTLNKMHSVSYLMHIPKSAKRRVTLLL